MKSKREITEMWIQRFEDAIYELVMNPEYELDWVMSTQVKAMRSQVDSLKKELEEMEDAG